MPSSAELYASASIDFAEYCCQAHGKKLPAGPFDLDDLTIAEEGNRKLRFSPLGNTPAAPKIALVGITPGGQIERFARYLRTCSVEQAARRAAFGGCQTQIKQLLQAHGFAKHINLAIDGDLNDSPDILTTSLVKCCLMVDGGYKFKAPDVGASPSATHCATVRFVAEMRSYSSLKWACIFGKPGWTALHELQLDGRRIIDGLRDGGMRVVHFPHFAQNFQQRKLFICDADREVRLIQENPQLVKYRQSAAIMRAELLREMRAEGEATQ